jgi:phosphatidylglycerol:prolipoprotein diacylglycerol transferase
MFPTLADLINYLLHTHLTLPIQTLGLFMALSFVFTYQVFVAEFKRKEADGLIHPFKKKIMVGAPASIIELVVNGLLGFLFGYKILGIIISYKRFLFDPKGFILSLQGSWICGLICALGFAYWAYHDRKKAQLPQPQVIEKTVHPYQLMIRMVFSMGFWGFIGAKLFDTVEHLDSLFYDPAGVLFLANGFTYYGGLVFGALAFLYIGHRHGMKLIHLADIGSPGMMLAYAIGRIGCQLSGDGDWGIVNLKPKPTLLQWLPDWMWSFNFPHNQANEGVLIPNCMGNYCKVLPHGVYPTSFYEVVICMLLFIFMWLIRKQIRVAGLMFYLYLILNSAERFLIETIRINVKYRFLGISLSQAEWLCVVMFTGGLIGICSIVYRKAMSLS